MITSRRPPLKLPSSASVAVLKVINSLTVFHPASSLIQPDVVRQKIKDALKRSANVEASHIDVSVDGGKVTLKGHVRTWFERGVIRDAAWAAPGVTEVRDQLAIPALRRQPASSRPSIQLCQTKMGRPGSGTRRRHKSQPTVTAETSDVTRWASARHL